MREKRGKDTKLLLILFISLVLVGGIILSNYLSFRNVNEFVVDKLKSNQLADTVHAAGRMENHLLQVKDELVTLSKFPFDSNQRSLECKDMSEIHDKVPGKIDSLLRTDKDGNIIECYSLHLADYLGLNVKNKEYYSVPKDTNEPFITEGGRQGQSTEIILAVPFFETSSYTPYPNFVGGFEGILLSVVDVNSLYNLYLHPYITPNRNYFYIVNSRTDETLLKSDSLMEYAKINQLLPDKNEQESIAYLEDFGETIITTSDILLGPQRWRLIVLTPIKGVSSDIQSIQKRHVFSLIFILVVSAVVVYSFFQLYRSRAQMQSKLEEAQVTLEKLGIDISVEKDKYSQADITLAPGRIYLVKDDNENTAHELFISSLNRGYAGLGIVREDPSLLKKKYNLKKTSFIWMTKTKSDEVPSETDINNLYNLVGEFVNKGEKSVILIDRLEYLIAENGFESIIKKIHDLTDLARVNECIVLLSINPAAVNESNLKTLESETIDLYGKELQKKVELSELEKSILTFVNVKNINNELVSYKDITSKFNITKPTTRSKIKSLQMIGLIQVEQRGRFKSLKITSAGRRLLN